MNHSRSPGRRHDSEGAVERFDARTQPVQTIAVLDGAAGPGIGNIYEQSLCPRRQRDASGGTGRVFGNIRQRFGDHEVCGVLDGGRQAIEATAVGNGDWHGTSFS